MAGQPKRRAMIAELERRTREELGDNHDALGYAEYWLAAGNSLSKLAGAMEVSYEMLRRYLAEIDPENIDTRLSRARARGAHVMVDVAGDAFDGITVFEPRDKITLAKAKSDTKLRVASMWNQREFGQKAQANVSITFNTLHMDALRHSPTAIVAVEEQHAISGAIEPDYEIASIDDTTS